ncbi:MAG: hypothetical protein A3K03_07485 [Bdellovibrionales bacterium RIFOXYD1_FULL_44_7]|nr:MAG: hypothetical protein A3K03_07485 [Bdellovibrionales bacterium RIFOXYD1_FULL_44_7]
MSRTSKIEKNIIFRYWKGILKTTFVVALLYILAKKGFLSLEHTKRAFTHLDKIIPAILSLFLTTFLTVIRWHWLLRAQNINLPFLRTVQLVFVGCFFNITLPGAVSGDFVKAFYIGKEVAGKRGYAFGSILFDRLAGLSALVLVSAGALIMDFGSLKGTPLLHGVQLLVTTAALCVVVFYGYLFLVRERHDPLLRLFKRLEKKYNSVGSLTRIYEGVRHYHAHRLTVLKVLLVSVCIHVIVCTSCLYFAAALGVSDLPTLAVFVIVPLGLLVTAVPILPAGVGTGHAAFGWLFQFLGTLRGADIFSLFAIAQFITGGVGGLVYLRFKSRAPALALELEREQKTST